MNKQTLISCPQCEKNGQRQILGEIDSDGFFTVMRFHKGTTKIISNQFAVVCGGCAETVFIRKGGHHENNSIRIEKFFGTASVSKTGTNGTYSNTA